MGEAVITAPEGKENEMVLPKRLLNALLMSHFYLACIAAGADISILEREIRDVRIEGDSVIVIYEEKEVLG